VDTQPLNGGEADEGKGFDSFLSGGLAEGLIVECRYLSGLFATPIIGSENPGAQDYGTKFEGALAHFLNTKLHKFIWLVIA
jgi:hypothetical protein